VIGLAAVLLGALLTAAVLLLLRRRDEQRLIRYQNKLLAQQIDEVHGLYQTMRGWRHDYHNHLQTLKTRLAMGQTEEALAYLEALETDLTSIRQISETGNLALDAVLNSKLSLVQQQGTRLSFKAAVPRELTVSEIDLCVLLGNLIDNAVESCETLDSEDRFIRLYIGVLKRQLYISITNATGEPARKLDSEYVTKKRGLHGQGLLRIDRIVKKYGGFINRQNEPGVFATEVLLPL